MNDIINNCSQSVLTDEQGAACFAIAERVVNALIKHGLHISFAESCTGGLVSSYKKGKWQNYSINCQRFTEFKNYLNAVTCCKNME